ncbi:RNA-directed DNA polymerase, eukaryota, reverse transcriptase zinc-binding domain protein, partial [Tanacetum coccineum]
VQCSLINATEQSMLYHVEVLTSQKSFYCTFIYAANKGRDGKELWKELNLNKRVIRNSAWVIMGDVNNCVNDVEIEDINCTRVYFTWTKSLLNPDAKILKKIDRVMSNYEFITQFNNANVVFLPFGIFDHSSAILKIPQVMVKKNKSFRIANYITDKVEFKDLVREKWEVNINGHSMYRLVKKLKSLKPHLNKLNWSNGNLFQKTAVLKVKLHEVQSKINKDPTNKMLRAEGVEVLKSYIEAAEEEEKLLMQKAKVQRLREGDKNTAYFHKVFKGRQNRSRILSICDEDGARYENCKVANQFIKHFEGFLGISPITDEIKRALFDTDDNKAPGPDGFTSKFFKKLWDTVNTYFCAAIKDFFITGKLLGEVNATIICLVPKMLTPQKVSDFRPITCYNVTYKCISKILTNRIKSTLNQIVDENQSAFVPERAITDNILLTQELLKGYNCANGPKRCSFKIDIQKAYDTVCWRFIEDILRRFGFLGRMVEWIMTCIASPKFTICVNGERYGYFKGGRGSRKGDPISPYIFTLKYINVHK